MKSKILQIILVFMLALSLASPIQAGLLKKTVKGGMAGAVAAKFQYTDPKFDSQNHQYLSSKIDNKNPCSYQGKCHARHVEYQGFAMIISKIDCQYIKEKVLPDVHFENIGKPCSLFNCVQVSLDVAQEMWFSDKANAVTNHMWSCMNSVFCHNPEKHAASVKETKYIHAVMRKNLSRDFAVQNIVQSNKLTLNCLTFPLVAASLEWLAYGDDPKHVWFRSMIPILLAGHLVCGFAGKKKKMYFGYKPEPVYYIC